MRRPTHLLVAAIGFPLLLAACGDAAVPPSGPTAETTAPTSRVSARAANRLRFQIKDRAANASFSIVDPSGCVETFVFVFGSNETVKEGPGKPSPGPLAVVQLSQYDFCNNTLGEYFGFAEDAAFEVEQEARPGAPQGDRSRIPRRDWGGGPGGGGPDLDRRG